MVRAQRSIAAHYPIEVVERCVRLYFRFALSSRNVDEVLAKRPVQLTIISYSIDSRRSMPVKALTWIVRRLPAGSAQPASC